MYPANLDVIKSKVDQVMMIPELSLGPSTGSMSTTTATGDHKSVSSSSLTSDLSYEAARCLKKRKSFNDHMVQQQQAKTMSSWRTTDDLLLRDDHHQVKRDRLPLDWEQCLDLKSGKMYFLNRKTSEKSWDRPKLSDDHHHNQNQPTDLALELNNISSPTPSPRSSPYSSHSLLFKASQKPQPQLHETKPVTAHQYRVNPFTCSSTTTKATATASSGNNMVALPCSNCHLLVIVSKSTPSCPNCKYVHYLHQNLNHDTKQDFKPSAPSSNLKPTCTLTLFS